MMVSYRNHREHPPGNRFSKIDCQNYLPDKRDFPRLLNNLFSNVSVFAEIGPVTVSKSILLISFLLFSGCATPGKRPTLLWNERVAVVKADFEDKSVTDKFPQLKRIVDEQNQPTEYFQTNPDHLNLLISEGFSRVKSPSFDQIDTTIHKRRARNDLQGLWHGYKDEIITEKILRWMAREFPEYARLYQIGTSLKGRPIYALRISDNPNVDEDEPSILFNGSHHGNEPLTIDYVLDTALILLASTVDKESLAKKLPDSVKKYSNKNKDKFRKYVNEFESWFVPVVNPDGLYNFWNLSANSGRKNGRDTYQIGKFNDMDGVDLNRNYPFFWNSGKRFSSSSSPGNVFYRGKSPGSEVETQTMMSFARKERFSVSLSYHCFATKVLVPYTADGARTPVPSVSWQLGKILASLGRSYRADKDYIAARNLYPVDGTDQDWLFHEIGTQAFIVEGSYHTPEYRNNGLRSIHGLRDLSLGVYSFYEETPVVRVKVSSAHSKSIEARIIPHDRVFMENEIRTTHPVHGSIDIFLPRPGRITFTVSASGYTDKTVTTDCDEGLCILPITLTRKK